MRNYQDIVRAWIDGDKLLASLATSEQRRAIGLIAAGTASEAQLEAAGDEFVVGVKANLPHEIRASGGPSPRAHEARENVITWKFSDEKPDRMGDIIRLGGWKLEHYKQNPVILWGHGAGIDSVADEPIGRTLDVRVQKDGLYGDILFAAEESDRAARIYRLAKSGFISAGSVGFRPLKTQHVQDEDERSKLGLGRFGVIFEETELLEFSLVAVPANPNALQQSLKSGSITTADVEELSSLRPLPTERDCERLMRKKIRSATLPVISLPPIEDEEFAQDDLRRAVKTLSDSLSSHKELVACMRAFQTTLEPLAPAIAALAQSAGQNNESHERLAIAITDFVSAIQLLRSSQTSAPRASQTSSLRGLTGDQQRLFEAIEAFRRDMRK